MRESSVGEDMWGACCARAASGHAAATPPSAASNSRRPMVTVIRPSRSRCVSGTIARHERAVFTVQGGQVLSRAARHATGHASPPRSIFSEALNFCCSAIVLEVAADSSTRA